MEDERMKDINVDADRNADPITGALGAHPVGVGVGAVAVGALAGGAAGAVAGPVGVVVGAVAGAVAGGYAGKAVAEAVDPTVEDAFWRDNHRSRPYYEAGVEYGNYQPAYQYGWESRQKYQDKTFDEMEPELQVGWSGAKTNSKLSWDKAKHATRDAWERTQPPTRCSTNTMAPNAGLPF